jgi:hypothetical protein
MLFQHSTFLNWYHTKLKSKKSDGIYTSTTQVLVMLVVLVLLQVELVVLQVDLVVLQASPCRRMCLLMGVLKGEICWIHWDRFWCVLSSSSSSWSTLPY